MKEQQVADHVQFLITEIGPVTPRTPKTPSSAKATRDFEREPPDDFELVATEPLVSPQIFCQVFPFHLMFDRQMRIVQAGKSVSRVIPKTVEENCPLLEVLEPVRPHIQLSFQTILAHISTIYVLKTKQGAMLEPDMFMRLKVKTTPSSYIHSFIHSINVMTRLIIFGSFSLFLCHTGSDDVHR